MKTEKLEIIRKYLESRRDQNAFILDHIGDEPKALWDVDPSVGYKFCAYWLLDDILSSGERLSHLTPDRGWTPISGLVVEWS